jgi:hypothetical protein
LTAPHSLNELRILAARCDKARKGKPLKALLFLQMADIIPYGIEWKRGNQIPQTKLNPRRIPGKYLAEVAYDWDKDGETTATEFVEALAFEVEGTEENDIVSEVTAGLGRGV